MKVAMRYLLFKRFKRLNRMNVRELKGFMGQATAFQKKYIKSNVLTLGENKPASEAQNIAGAAADAAPPNYTALHLGYARSSYTIPKVNTQTSLDCST